MAGALLQGVAHDLDDDAGLVVHEDDRGQDIAAALRWPGDAGRQGALEDLVSLQHLAYHFAG